MSLPSAPRRRARLVSALLGLAAVVSGAPAASPVVDAERVAQWGDPSKVKPTPRRTPGNTANQGRQNNAAQRPGNPFGAMQK